MSSLARRPAQRRDVERRLAPAGWRRRPGALRRLAPVGLRRQIGVQISLDDLDGRREPRYRFSRIDAGAGLDLQRLAVDRRLFERHLRAIGAQHRLDLERPRVRLRRIQRLAEPGGELADGGHIEFEVAVQPRHTGKCHRHKSAKHMVGRFQVSKTL